MRYVPLLLLLLVGCGLPQGAGRATHGGPLRASLISTGVGFDGTFHLSRPAYVAIFEILPGRGVHLLSRATGESGYYPGGRHGLLATASADRPGYSYATWTGIRPRYLFMIAADEPLDVGSYRASSMVLLRELGMRRYSAFDPYQTMDALLPLVLPPGYTGEVATDVLVEWPTIEPAVPRLWRIAVRCENEETMVVTVPRPMPQEEVMRLYCRRGDDRDTMVVGDTLEVERPDRPEPDGPDRPTRPATSQILDRPVRPPRPEPSEPEIRPVRPPRPEENESGPARPPRPEPERPVRPPRPEPQRPPRPEPPSPSRPERPEPPSRSERVMPPSPGERPGYDPLPER